MDKLLYTAKLQDRLGYMEIKLGIIDIMIKASEKDGYLTTKSLMSIRSDLEERHNRELVLEEMETLK